MKVDGKVEVKSGREDKTNKKIYVRRKKKMFVMTEIDDKSVSVVSKYYLKPSMAPRT